MKLQEVIMTEFSAKATEEAELALQRAHDCEIEITEWLASHNITNATVAGYVVQAPGVKLMAEFFNENLSGWRVTGHCPNCGTEVWSSKIHGRNNLADIGKMMVEFKPDFWLHQCEQRAIETPEARLVNVIKDIVQDILGNQ